MSLKYVLKCFLRNPQVFGVVLAFYTEYAVFCVETKRLLQANLYLSAVNKLCT